MRAAVVALLAAGLSALVLSAAPAMAEQVSIGDQFRSNLAHPERLSLWASDALVGLRWSGWGGPVATATGQISTHAEGQYSYDPATVRASRRRMCGGRLIYSKLLYRWDGRWYRAKLYGNCRFSA